MKTLIAILSMALGLSIIATDAYARGRGGGGGGRSGGGGGRAKASHSRSSRSSSPARRSSSSSRSSRNTSSRQSAHRSPTTGSRTQRSSSRTPSKSYTRQATRPTSKPASRPSSRPSSKPTKRQSTRPAKKQSTRPGNKPSTRPGNKPSTRPGAGNANKRPGNKPSTRPGAGNANKRPGNKPSTRPGAGNTNKRPGNANKRPGNNKNRPSTLPGMVTYPKHSGGGNKRPGAGNKRPGAGNKRPGLANNRPSGRPGSKNNRPGGNRNNNRNKGNLNNNRRNKAHINNVNVGRRNRGLNNPANLPANRRNWNSNKWGGNRGVWGNNNTININNNFRHSNNYAYRPNYWGARPWWGASSCHSWHRGHWNYGYSNRYYRHSYYNSSFASGFVWGIAAWSFGNMIYDMGYNSYRNPYPAPSVTYNVYPDSGGGSSKSSIDYNEPVSVTAAANPPGDDEKAQLAETKSDESLKRSRTAFKQRDYMAAMKSVDEAIAYTPGDVTLHEYRALIFFTLGRYADAAGVLNPVLASGPGWGWDTMIEFYDATTTYDEQVAKLEAYVKGTPKAADARFVLGYHYLVQGYMDKSYAQFEEVVKLQPNDSIARQLRDLAKSSLPDPEQPEGETSSPAPEIERPDPIPTEKLVGTWVSDRGDAGKITFKMEEDGKFNWNYIAGDQSSELKGTYGINDDGLLVLSMDEDDAQMVSIIDMKDDNDMHFTIVGSPDGDPGLDFTK